MKLLLVFVIFGLSHFCYAQGEVYISTEKKINLIELYSSQGCSSCPPAERWVSKLKNNPKLWKTFVPLEFHVDYWNYLGWIDKFSKKEYATRQRFYASEWKKRTVYTPQFVLNGVGTRIAHRLGARKLGDSVGVLKVTHLKGDTYKAEFRPTMPEHKLDGRFKVFGAFLGNEISTKVTAGENTGETLVHEFVVLSMAHRNMKKMSNGVFAIEFDLPKKNKGKAKSFSIAFWVSNQVSLKPIQAVGAAL